MMRKFMIAIGCLMLIGHSVFGANPTSDRRIPSHANAPVDCSICHSCPMPTNANPCLKEKPGKESTSQTAPGESVPEIVEIGQLENLFNPTRFNHKAHAEMASMGKGCQNCHHNVEPGQEHIACRECHIDGINMENPSQPGLRGVYHRMCMRCHSEWNEDTQCQNCHARKGEPDSKVQAAVMSSPASTIKELLVFETNYKEGDKVPFHHKRHTEVYGFDCQMCHKNDGCFTCHQKDNSARNVVRNIHNQMENQCFLCHSNNSCDHCHGRAEDDLFVHAQIKSVKSEVFETMTCRNCHGHGGPYGDVRSTNVDKSPASREMPPKDGTDADTGDSKNSGTTAQHSSSYYTTKDEVSGNQVQTRMNH